MGTFVQGKSRFARAFLAVPLLLSLFAFVGLTPAASSSLAFYELECSPSAPARKLMFPADKCYGFVDVVPRVRGKKGLKSQRYAAQGKIDVPKDMVVGFVANRFFFEKPQIIKGFAPDSFDVVTLKLLSMDDSEDDLVDRALAAMTHLKGIRALVLDKSDASDEGFKSVAKLTGLEKLNAFLVPSQGALLKDCTTLKKLKILCLDSVTIKEEYLKYLREYSSLRSLSLSHTGLGDVGLKSIGACTNIEELVISRNSRITDAGLAHLKSLSKLRSINLLETSVTAKGLLALKGLPLRSLLVSSTNISESEASMLKAAFPGLNISIKNEKPKVDEDTNTIFGQMSRQRKL